jgi:hypothetical protein
MPGRQRGARLDLTLHGIAAGAVNEKRRRLREFFRARSGTAAAPVMPVRRIALAVREIRD